MKMNNKIGIVGWCLLFLLILISSVVMAFIKINLLTSMPQKDLSLIHRSYTHCIYEHKVEGGILYVTIGRYGNVSTEYIENKN